MKSSRNILNRCFPYSDNATRQWPQILAILIVTLGSYNNGAIFNWTSPAIPILTSNATHLEQPFTLEEASYFAVIPTATAAGVTPILTFLSNKIGRQKTVMLIPITYLFSWSIIAFANSLYIFYLARFIQGIGDATCFTALPMYIGEISEPKVRGSWGNLIALSMFIGFFTINIIGAYCDIWTTACVFGSIAFINIILASFVPESPHFLIMKGREDEARTSLQNLRWKQDVNDELKSLKNDVQRQLEEAGGIKDLFTDPTIFKTLMISVGLRMCQPFSGLPAFTMYTQYIFLQAGSNLSASTCAIIFSGVFCFCMAGFSSVVERFGRRPLMTFSCFGCGIILALESIYYFINEKTDLDVSSANWLPLAGMLSYIPLCASGLAIIPTLMLGELFPASVKAQALCILHIVYATCLITVSKLFPTLSSNFGMYVPFCFFSACCLINTVFSYYFIPETKGKTLEEIQQSLKSHSDKRNNVNSKW